MLNPLTDASRWTVRGNRLPPLSWHRELEIEAGITTYVFANGIEKRKQAFPASAFKWLIVQMTNSFQVLQQSVQNALFNLKPFVESIHRSFAVQPPAATRDLRRPASPPPR